MNQSEPIGPQQLLEVAPLRAVLRLAAPTTGVMLAASLSNILLTYFVSRLGSEAIATVALVFPVSILAMTVMAGGIGAGASSAIARALGADDRVAAADAAEHAILLSVGAGLGFGAVILPGAPYLFRLMGASGKVLDDAVLFARVLFGGAVLTFFGSMLDSTLRGEGNVRIPAIWSTGSLVLQMLLTPVYMFSLGFGLVGAPLATLSCQLLASVPRAVYVFGGWGIVQPRPWPRRFTFGVLREILRVGIPASISTTINYVGIMVLTAVVARVGTSHLAAYGLGTRMDFLLLSLAYGFGAAVLTLVGLASGAQRYDRLGAYVSRAGVIMVTLLAVLATALVLEPRLWLGLFTDDEEILTAGATYFQIIGPSYPLMGISMVIAFAFQGLGRATAPLILMAVRVSAVVGVSLLCTQVFGADERAVFLSIAVGNAGSAAVMLLLFRRTLRIVSRPNRP